MKIITIFTIILSFSYGLTGLELIDLMLQQKRPSDSRIDLIMRLTNKKGKTRESYLRSFSKNDGSKQIIWFLKPASDKGIAFLKIEHDDKPDQMQMWLPAFKRVKRISAGKRSDSFMGSDMSYEDMSNRQKNEFDYDILGTEHFKNNNCYILESKPKNDLKTEYSKHVTWVDSSLMIPLKEISYDKLGKLLKEKYYSYSIIDNYQILTKVKVINIPSKHSTEIQFRNITLNNNFNNNIFHEKALKRIPN
tara:strand:- start:273 stop:1019 length:747 start_codon:yes stop_codon:yes gene_type:complete